MILFGTLKSSLYICKTFKQYNKMTTLIIPYSTILKIQTVESNIFGIKNKIEIFNSIENIETFEKLHNDFQNVIKFSCLNHHHNTNNFEYSLCWLLAITNDYLKNKQEIKNVFCGNLQVLDNKTFENIHITIIL